MKKDTMETLIDIANGESQPPELSMAEAQEILNYIKKIEELCDKYEEEHDSTFITWQDTIRRHYEAIKILKKHKQDLDYEPWSEYKISGKILFDLVKTLEGDDD